GAGGGGPAGGGRGPGARGGCGWAAGRAQPGTVAARARAVGSTGEQVRAVACRGGAAGGWGGACLERDREPEQPTAELLLPAQATGAGLPEVAEVLPQSPAPHAERTSAAAGQEPARTADGTAARALAGTVGLPALLAPVTPGPGCGTQSPPR